jgi:hypothetical protein
MIFRVAVAEATGGPAAREEVTPPNNAITITAPVHNRMSALRRLKSGRIETSSSIDQADVNSYDHQVSVIIVGTELRTPTAD